MRERYRRVLHGGFMALFAMALIAITGCEWEGSGDEGAWSERYDYMNFSGVYRPVEGREFIVHSFGGAPADQENGGQGTVSNRQIGSGDGVSTVYSGVMAERPIIAASVSIVAGGYQVTDDNGVLSGNGATGNINYDTGAWSIDFGVPLAIGAPIIGAWRYDADVATAAVPGSSRPIYQLTVEHTGNRVLLIDNDANRYEGSLGKVDTDGSHSDDGNMEQRVSFNARGTAYGRQVEIVGSFQALVNTVPTPSVVSRTLTGTWIESPGGTGRIDAVGPRGHR